MQDLTKLTKEELSALAASLKPEADAFKASCNGNMYKWDMGFATALPHVHAVYDEIAHRSEMEDYPYHKEA